MDGVALDRRAPNVIGPARPPNHDVIAASPDGFALLTTPNPLPRVRFYPPPTGWLQTRPRKKTAAARSYQRPVLGEALPPFGQTPNRRTPPP